MIDPNVRELVIDREYAGHLGTLQGGFTSPTKEVGAGGRDGQLRGWE